MKLITRLLESVAYRGTYNVILVVVNELSKMCHYIPCRSDITARKLAEVIMGEVIQLHGVPSAIISECGSLFTSQFWANLIYSF